MTIESKEAAVARWRVALQAASQAIFDKYSYAAVVMPTGAELYKDADHWWRVATKFNENALELSHITAADVYGSETNMIELLELRSYAKQLDPLAPIRPEDATFAIPRMQAPIDWLMRVGGGVFAYNIKVDQLVDDVKNAPSTAIKWALEQFFKSLHLPTWLVPVLGVAAVAGLGWWGYQTFLAPATRASRLLVPAYRNPHRRRRRRRKMLVAS